IERHDITFGRCRKLNSALLVHLNTHYMEMIPILLQEFEQEAKTTRKFLERVPSEKFTWRPHEKSMDLRSLSVHLAELPRWVQMGLTTEGLDFETAPYKPSHADSTEDLLRIFESS